MTTIVTQTYDQYLVIREELLPLHRWMDDVISDKRGDEIFLKTTDFVLISDYKWDKKDVKQMHLLAILTDRTVMTLRDLKPEHIPTLKNIKEDCTSYINRVYGFDEEVSVYFHYPPSCWILHLHFTHKESKSLNEQNTFSFDEVIKQLETGVGFINDMTIMVNLSVPKIE